ncbi:MAG TPA: DUF3788 family protein [Thermoplasmata archaeon]|nr:DUF3788 family protein [Thermoplasmata archaeon]
MEATAGSGSVEALVAALGEPGRSLLQALRAAVLQLGGVSEKLIVDYDVRSESPAFYVGARQLCHAHPMDDKVEVTVSLSRTLTFEVLASREIPEAVRMVVERTREYGATRWMTVPVAKAEEIPGVMTLVRLKHRFLYEGSDDLAIPKDQTTLEKFE